MSEQLTKEGEAILLHICGKKDRNLISKRELEIRLVNSAMNRADLEYLLFCENANHPYFNGFPKERLAFLRRKKLGKVAA